jgi:serine/threonine protein kinase
VSFTAGARFGGYEILSTLGAGGMGAVYRARDVKLGREVALKVLPELFATDPDRLARFEREAKTLAALNHPHIAQIYGFEQSEGRPALAMELVEGEDLSQRIAREAMPLDDALPIAKQIAEALEAAHEQGIIHRDLKPANIKVRDDGTVKVLDFGLAKAMESGVGSREPGVGRALVDSPTITSPAMTQAGIILGTAAYMAPEQARGRAVDKRADIWAFGCVLYEMLTGHRAFDGDDVSIVLASVLKDEIRWDALPAGTPATLRTLLRRMLERDPRQRLDSAAAVRLEIVDLLTRPVTETRSLPPPSARGARALLPWAAASTAGVLALVFAALWMNARSPVTDPPETRVEIVTPATSDPGSIALSPDGQQIAFVATADGQPALWVRSLASGQARALKGTAAASQPFWSPDARSIAFFAESALKRIDLQGETVVVLARVGAACGGTWHQEGGILFTASCIREIRRLQAGAGSLPDRDGSGGEGRSATTLLPGQAGHALPDWLGDGRHFVFTTGGTPDTRGVWVASVDGGEARRLVDADFARVALPDILLFVRQNTLFAQRLTSDFQALAGEATAVTTLDGGVTAGLSVSASGALAYRGGARVQGRLRWFKRSGASDPEADDADTAALRSAEVSFDGRFLAGDRMGGGMGSDVWVRDLRRGILTRLTVDPAVDRFPTWTPDGKTIIFSSNRGSQTLDLFMRPASSDGRDEVLLADDAVKHPLAVSPDGRTSRPRPTATASGPSHCRTAHQLSSRLARDAARSHRTAAGWPTSRTCRTGTRSSCSRSPVSASAPRCRRQAASRCAGPPAGESFSTSDSIHR